MAVRLEFSGNFTLVSFVQPLKPPSVRSAVQPLRSAVVSAVPLRFTDVTAAGKSMFSTGRLLRLHVVSCEPVANVTVLRPVQPENWPEILFTPAGISMGYFHFLDIIYSSFLLVYVT